jgi:hypothetical protein
MDVIVFVLDGYQVVDGLDLMIFLAVDGEQGNVGFG